MWSLLWVWALLGATRTLFRTRAELALENLALRQQVAVLIRSRGGRRLRLGVLDRAFWVVLSQRWAGLRVPKNLAGPFPEIFAGPRGRRSPRVARPLGARSAPGEERDARHDEAHEVQVLRRAGVTQEQVAKLTGISVRAVRTIEAEEPVVVPDDGAERERRGIGRPSKAEPFRGFVAKVLAEDPDLLSLEVLRRARLEGYQGGKSALYGLVASLRPRLTRPMVRFEGLPGEFAQHDFGHVDVRFMDGTTKRIHFFASRLKFSRWVEVTIVADEQVETLVRRLVGHFTAFGGVPLLSVFDRPKTVALHWDRDGTVTEWKSTFAAARSSPPRRGRFKAACLALSLAVRQKHDLAEHSAFAQHLVRAARLFEGQPLCDQGLDLALLE